MESYRLWCLLFVFLCHSTFAQVNRYFVFFTDKNNNGYSLQDPKAFLTSKSLQRRMKNNVAIKPEDLPLVPSYIQGVSALGAKVLYGSKWLNGVAIQCDAALVPAIKNLFYVRSVEWIAPYVRPVSNGRKKQYSFNQGGTPSPMTTGQLEMISIDAMHKEGFRGEGIVIAIFDSGFQGVNIAEAFQHLFIENRIELSANVDFVHGQKDVFNNDIHGTEVLSVMGAYLPGTFVGGAYKATYQLYITEDITSEFRIEEYNWAAAAERADSLGVDIIQSSLGYNLFDDPSMNYTVGDLDGKTTVISRIAQMAAERGIVVVVSAGNEGGNTWKTITAPADARDVLAVGAVKPNGTRSFTSSIGPSADGRIKPDVVALGVGTSVVGPTGVVTSGSGTSFSAPLVASLVAGIWQKFPTMQQQQIVEIIRLSASQSLNPDPFRGYGIPDFRAVSNYHDWIPQDEPFVVYPNPMVDTVTIRPSNPEMITQCKLECVSSDGKTMVENRMVYFNWRNRVFTANTKAFPPGVYIWRIYVEDKVFTYKMAKQ